MGISGTNPRQTIKETGFVRKRMSFFSNRLTVAANKTTPSVLCHLFLWWCLMPLVFTWRVVLCSEFLKAFCDQVPGAVTAELTVSLYC